MSIRLFSDWILVQLDPPTSKSELIETVHDSSVFTGTIKQVGPGRPRKDGNDPMDVVPGERVAFARWHGEHRPGKAQAAALERLGFDLNGEVMLIRQNDIFFAFTGPTPRLDI